MSRFQGRTRTRYISSVQAQVNNVLSLFSGRQQVSHPAQAMQPLLRRHAIMKNRAINLVLDVGANSGQFAREMRELGYSDRIVSFEPLRDAFTTLERNSSRDPLWTCYNIALGDADSAAVINISANSYSSSILPLCDGASETEPGLACVGKQEVAIRRLDGLLQWLARPADVIYLKIDTQGYERQVLEGALGIIDRLSLVQVETAISPSYIGQRLMGEMVDYLGRFGFHIVSIEPGWEHPKTRELLEVDLIFGRAS